MALLISRILINLFDAIAGVVFVYKFTNGKKLKNREFLLCAISVVAFLLLASWNYDGTNYLISDPLPLTNAMLQVLALLLVSFGCGTGSIISKIVAPVVFECILLYLNSAYWMSTISNMLRYPAIALSLTTFTTVLTVVMIKLFMTSVLMFIVKVVTYKGKYRLITTVTYILSPIFTTFTLYIFMKILFYRVNEYAVETIIASIGTAGVNIFSFFLFDKMLETAEENGKLQLSLCRAEFEQEKYSELLSINAEINAIKHDLKNQLMCVNRALQTGDASANEMYIKELSGTIDSIGTPLLSGNSLIDYIISSKINEASGIKVVVVGTVSDICMKDIDLSILIGNILDNAIEALESVESEEKLIEFSCSEYQGYQNIVVKNSISESVLEKNGLLETTKDSKEHHGFGVRSIRKIAEKYDGVVRFYEEENKFCVHVAIPV